MNGPPPNEASSSHSLGRTAASVSITPNQSTNPYSNLAGPTWQSQSQWNGCYPHATLNTYMHMSTLAPSSTIGKTYAHPYAHYPSQMPGQPGVGPTPEVPSHQPYGRYPAQSEQFQSHNSPYTRTHPHPSRPKIVSPPSLPPPSLPPPSPQQVKPPSPSPPPLPHCSTYAHWETPFLAFFAHIGFTQTIHAFQTDFMVLNPHWERKRVKGAVRALARELGVILERMGTGVDDEREHEKYEVKVDVMGMDVDPPSPPPQTTLKTNDDTLQEQTLDTRKLSFVHPTNELFPPRTQSTINREISQFIARTRASNNASNRQEFLLSVAEKKRLLQASSFSTSPNSSSNDSPQSASAPTENTTRIASCARTDAKSVNRDAQIRYDIARNDEGPLGRSMQGLGVKQCRTEEPEGQDSIDPAVPMGPKSNHPHPHPSNPGTGEDPPSSRYPGLSSRLQNIEEHLGVRYVPSPPHTLLARLKFLEDHLVKLEREYPPWAGLMFFQPGRMWPPPPPTTPIIVPPHLRAPVSSIAPSAIPSSNISHPSNSSSQTSNSNMTSSIPAQVQPQSQSLSTNPSLTSNTATKKGPKNKSQSSLHKAVMERLEVQRALSDLEGRRQG